MSLTILHNASAAVANRLLGSNDMGVSRAVAKLSAGSRVLAARDDAAALAIGSRLRAEVASLAQAAVNAGQAVSMLQIADGAAAQIDIILLRMKALAVQSGSDQVGQIERALLNNEFQALNSEADRIAKSTNFNGRALLEGDVENGVVYTLRSKAEHGTVYLNGKALYLGDNFNQDDLATGRVSYVHNGDGATSDRLIVSVADRNGLSIGTQAGEIGRQSFHTAEFSTSTGLDNIFASAAYARGATGAGITVAVIDTGIDLNHQDFVGKIAAAADIVDTTVEGLFDAIAANTFVSGGGGEVSEIHLYDVDEAAAFFEAGYVPSLNVTGAAGAASVTLSINGVDYSALVNLDTGGVGGTWGFTLTEVNGTREIDIGLTSNFSAGAITSTGPVLVQFETPTTGDGNDDNGAPDGGHGTHEAGIIAGNKNGNGSHGVAYNAELIAVNVGQAGGGLDFNDVADAIDFARANGADVINMSLGADGFGVHTALQNAIARAVNAGIIIVASAGNSALDDPGFPANFAINGNAKGMLIAVVATDDDNGLASFSNKAGTIQNFSVAAPGVAIVSATNDGLFGQKSGTSMAAPMVSGAVALLREKHPELSGQEIASLLFTATTDLGEPGIDKSFGRGLINMDKATAALQTISINLDPTKTVAGSVNALADKAVALNRSVLDYVNAYVGRVNVADRSLSYKVGTGVLAQDSITVAFGSVTTNSLGLEGSAIDTLSGAAEAIDLLSQGLDRLVNVRAQIGAAQNRLDVAISNLLAMSENTESSRSQLMDLDIAQEMMVFTSRQILTQASISMVSQSNQQAQQLLRLLG